MSVHVPNHLTICPSLLRRGSARPSIQWYSPSWRRRRYSISYGWPVEVASFQSLQATGRSSGWNGGFHPSPKLSSRQSGELEPLAVDVLVPAVGPGDPHDLGQRLDERPPLGLAGLESGELVPEVTDLLLAERSHLLRTTGRLLRRFPP